MNERLAVMLSWVDDIMALGHPEDVKQMKDDLKIAYECTCEGALTEYVRNKINITRKSNGLADVKFPQAVLVQKLEDEYLENNDGKAPKTPAVAGKILVKGDGNGTMEERENTVYRSATATCMYIMQWSRPDIYNATRGQSRQMASPREAHVKAL